MQKDNELNLDPFVVHTVTIIMVIISFLDWIKTPNEVPTIVVNAFAVILALGLFLRIKWAKILIITFYSLLIVVTLISAIFNPSPIEVILLPIFQSACLIFLLIGYGSKEKAILLGIIPFFVITPFFIFKLFFNIYNETDKMYQQYGKDYYHSYEFHYSITPPPDWKIIKISDFHKLGLGKLYPKEFSQGSEIVLIKNNDFPPFFVTARVIKNIL